MRTLGQRVKAARLDKDWTMKQLAINAELSMSFICDIENDRREVSMVSVKKLSDALNMSVEWLVRGRPIHPMRCPMCKGSGKIT